MAFHFSLLRGMDALTEFKLYRYKVSYAAPFSQRTGILLQLFRDGKESWGEIAPLPGRSKETLPEALQQLLSILKNETFSKVYPSVSFGLFSAYSPSLPAQRFPLCALLAGTAEQILRKAEIAHAQGYQCAKVKVSGLDKETACALLKELSHHFSLRVDANRAFSFKEAMTLCMHAEAHLWEYIEEPTYELEKLEHFPYPFALDESLLDLKALPQNPQCTALILKPSILGGYEECLSYAAYGKKLILSSACETGIGILGIAALSSALSLQAPLGLDTYRFMERDVLTTPLDFSNGELIVPQTLSVNKELLEGVAYE
jgi:o-succinylbenzoate synthase